ncbi:MAG: protein phosphatase 2C domain-containing protein [Oscillospiraceae bacterium]|nr:protein phosphatase 2C domain-containing protein [Oscillospiraceae bacterium]
MDFTTAYISGKGTEKSVNQDSLLIKEAVLNDEKILFAAVCDGMGGLSDGELASSSVINMLSDWFEDELPEYVCSSDSILRIRKSFDIMLHRINDRINDYSAKNYKQLGTTMTAVLMMTSVRKMLICHVGDSRVYKITDRELCILTHDHSVVARDVRDGKITPEQARSDPRQNMLTKCIGSGLSCISYDYMVYDLEKNITYMLCTDGLRKKLKDDEILHELSPCVLNGSCSAQSALEKLLELVIKRGETDDISALTICLSD